MTNVVVRSDCRAKQLHNRSRCFVQMKLEHHHRVRRCKHRHGWLGCIGADCIVLDRGLAVVVVVRVNLELVGVLEE